MKTKVLLLINFLVFAFLTVKSQEPELQIEGETLKNIDKLPNVYNVFEVYNIF